MYSDKYIKACVKQCTDHYTAECTNEYTERYKDRYTDTQKNRFIDKGIYIDTQLVT